MTTRGGGRSSHVRPRPPSTGRPKPSKAPRRTVVPTRIPPTRQRPARGFRLPFAARLALVAAIAVLGIAVFGTAVGGASRAFGMLGAGVDDFLGKLTATPTPEPTEALAIDAPLIQTPADGEPYTNQPTVDLVVTIPAGAVGRADTNVRIYLALPDQVPAPILEVPVGATPRLIVPVELSDGQNDFTATLVGPSGESDSSPLVTWILDTAPPAITLTAPANGATINRDVVELRGTTQARSALVARNEANAASATAVAGPDGAFILTLPIVAATNGITIQATDPAGNVAESVVSVRRGSGVLAAALSASTYRVSVASLPQSIELSVLVTDPDGRALAGAAVTFTLTLPGIPPLAADATSGGDGRAVFRTTIPAGASTGGGLAAVLVSTDQFGSVSDRTVVTMVP